MENNSTIRIALADDHAIVRKGLAELIGSMPGLEIILDADNGKELMSKLAVAPLKPDVCILDINMPEMDGYDTAAAIREAYGSMGILALSMYDTEFNIIKMLRSGAQGYLLKNAQPPELRRAITDVHLHGFYHSELVSGRLMKVIQDRKAGSDLNGNEEQFLHLCCTEMTYKEIADKMNKSPRTIDGYRDDLFSKLGITSRTGLVM
ncbi:MAG: response regulator transcription factor, partial [Sphingobacteriales bacterium]